MRRGHQRDTKTDPRPDREPPRRDRGIYRERVVRELGPSVEALWIFSLGTSQAPCRHRIPPDGCVDVIQVGDEVRVVGPMTRARTVTMPPGTITAGVRLRPGAAGHLLGASPAALADLVVPAFEFPRLRVALDGRGASRPNTLQGLVETFRAWSSDAGTPPPTRSTVLYAAAALTRAPSRSVRELAATCGWSERHFRRVFTEHLGLGPKLFARIQRLQGFLRRVGASGPHRSLGTLAFDSGYADQAHLARDCRALLGTSPSHVVREMSDSSKTGPPSPT